MASRTAGVLSMGGEVTFTCRMRWPVDNGIFREFSPTRPLVGLGCRVFHGGRRSGARD
jgi:hypothetical protein